MLQKLRSRHPIDLPVERWGRRRAFLTVLGGLAVLALLVPLALAFLGPPARAAMRGDQDGLASFVLRVGVGLGVLALVLLVYAAKGKPGHDR
jgi:hypothetical protein